MQNREPLVFGDPEAPMTVGAFIRWLEEQFDPHDERDAQQSYDIKAVNIAVLGNGDPKHGMKYKVDSMWDMMQRVDATLAASKMFWRIAFSVLGGVATIVVILHNLGRL